MNRKIYALLLGLLLPACALAVTEGVVEDAPEISIELPQLHEIEEPKLLDEAYREMAERLAQTAIEASSFLLGSPEDMELVLAQAPVWYSPARIGQDGSVEYDSTVQEGLELSFERRGSKVVRNVSVLFDLETERPIRFRNEYEMGLDKSLYNGTAVEDGFALRLACAGLEEFPGCEQIEMSLSPKSDGRYAIAYGRTAHGWHVNITIDRAERYVVSVEWISDDQSIPVNEMME